MNSMVKLLVFFSFFITLSIGLPSNDRLIDKTKDPNKNQIVADRELIANNNDKPAKLCGYDDVLKHRGNRQKRYALLPSKWGTWKSGTRNLLLWSFDNSHPNYKSKVNDIRENIREATQVWSENSVLSFSEVNDRRNADIVISFQPEYHTNIDPYAINDTLYAHSFPPASGLGGDIHIRDNQVWHFDLNKPTPSRSSSFYAVVLHELGHALGLGHSDYPEAVMYESFSDHRDPSKMLHEDDIKGIEHIYGKKRTDQMIATPQLSSEELPERCSTDFDAATRLRGELFLFKNQYLWRPRKNQDAFKIRDIFNELPADMTHVDAVYETQNNMIWFFIGRKIYIFNKNKLQGTKSLKDIGISQQKYQKIDAIFRWPFNNRTFIFSGYDYFRLDGNFKIDQGYPKEIAATWRDVFDIDTAFSDTDNLYFFKGQNSYKFDTARMQINRMNATTIGSTFMGCIDLQSRNAYTLDDVIYDFPLDELPEDFENLEKMDSTKESKEPNSGNSIHSGSVLTFVITIVSLNSMRLP